MSSKWVKLELWVNYPFNVHWVLSAFTSLPCGDATRPFASPLLNTEMVILFYLLCRWGVFTFYFRCMLFPLMACVCIVAQSGGVLCVRRGFSAFVHLGKEEGGSHYLSGAISHTQQAYHRGPFKRPSRLKLALLSACHRRAVSGSHAEKPIVPVNAGPLVLSSCRDASKEHSPFTIRVFTPFNSHSESTIWHFRLCLTS